MKKGAYNKSFYYYLGSGTEPPCSEGVERFIMKNSIKLP
jgi:carbonic anhydrase